MTTTPKRAPAAHQSAALRTLLTLTEQHPDLPGVYATFSAITPDEAGIQLAGPTDLETWRTALRAAPENMRLSDMDGSWHLRFTTQLNGVTIDAYTIFKPATKEGDHSNEGTEATA